MQWVIDLESDTATKRARELAEALTAIQSALGGIKGSVGVFEAINTAANNRSRSGMSAEERAANKAEKEQARVIRAHEKTLAKIERDEERQTAKAVRESEKRASAAEKAAQKIARSFANSDEYGHNWVGAKSGPSYNGAAAIRGENSRAAYSAAVIQRQRRQEEKLGSDIVTIMNRTNAWNNASGGSASSTAAGAERKAQEKLGGDIVAIMRRTEAANKASSGGSLLTLRNFYIAQQVLHLITRAAESAAHAIEGFIEKAVTNTSLRNAQVNSLELLTKNRHEAEAYYGVLNKIADSSFLSRKETIDSGKRFLGQGVNQQTTSALLLSIGDLTAGKEGGAAKMAAAISNVFNGRGRLTQVYNASDGLLSESSLRHATAVALHISEVAAAAGLKAESTKRAFLAAGIQESALGLDRQIAGPSRGLLGARGHAVGAASPGEQIGLLTEKFEALFNTVDQQPLTGFLRNLNDELSSTSDTTAKFRGIVENTFTDIMKPWLAQYGGGGGAKKLHADLMIVADGFKVMGEYAATASEAISGLVKAVVLLEPVLSPIARALKPTFFMLPRAIGAASDYLSHPAGSVVGAGAAGAFGSVPQTSNAEGAIVRRDHVSRVHAGELIVNPKQTSEIVDRALLGGGRGGGRSPIHVGGIHVYQNSGESSESLAQRVADLTLDRLATVFEQGAISLTGGP